MNSNNEIIDAYIEEFQLMLKENTELEHELFFSEYTNKDTFWQIFKEQAIVNLIKNNNPALTCEQLKDVHKKMFLSSIVETMEELRKKGLVNGDEISGYKLTETAKIVLNTISEDKKL